MHAHNASEDQKLIMHAHVEDSELSICATDAYIVQQMLDLSVQQAHKNLTASYVASLVYHAQDFAVLPATTEAFCGCSLCASCMFGSS